MVVRRILRYGRSTGLRGRGDDGGHAPLFTVHGSPYLRRPLWVVGELVQERCHRYSLVEREVVALVRAIEGLVKEPANGCPASALDEAALVDETAR